MSIYYYNIFTQKNNPWKILPYKQKSLPEQALSQSRGENMNLP